MRQPKTRPVLTPGVPDDGDGTGSGEASLQLPPTASALCEHQWCPWLFEPLQGRVCFPRRQDSPWGDGGRHLPTPRNYLVSSRAWPRTPNTKLHIVSGTHAGSASPCSRRKPPSARGASVLRASLPQPLSPAAAVHVWLSLPEMCWDVTSGARTRALKIVRRMCCQTPVCCQPSPPRGSWWVGDTVAQTAASSASGVVVREGPRCPGRLA